MNAMVYFVALISQFNAIIYIIEVVVGYLVFVHESFSIFFIVQLHEKSNAQILIALALVVGKLHSPSCEI